MVDIPLLIRDLVFFLLVAIVVNFITAKLSVPYTLGLVIVGLGIGSLHIAHSGVEYPLGVATHTFFPSAGHDR